MPKISEKIVAAEEFIQEKKSAVSALLAAADAEARDLTAEENAQVDEYSEAIEEKTGVLATLKRAEKSLAMREVSISQAKSETRFGLKAAKDDEPGSLIIRIAAAKAISHQDRISIDDAIAKLYGHNPELAEQLKTVVNPAATNVSGWASQLVQQGVTGFMEALVGVSVYGQLAAKGTGIDFGTNGSVSVPGWGSGGNISGSFVAEGAPIPVKRATMIAQTLNRYKMAVISTYTKELGRTSTPQIEGLIRRKMLDDTAQAVDVALLDTLAAIAGVRPASILNGAPTQASAGADAESVVIDMKFLLTSLTNQNAGRKPTLIMHPLRLLGLSMMTNDLGQFVFQADINSGKLFGADIIASTYVPATVVAMVDAADFATAFGTPEFEVSDVATIVEANDDGVAPQVTTVGAAATADAPPIRSLFQTWTTGVRMVMPLSWAMMRPTASYITGVAW